MPTGSTMLMRTAWHPRPHQLGLSYGHGMETGAVDLATIWPIVMYDEAMGAPDAYQSHPEHASFSQVDEPNCYPESRINNVFTEMRFALTKGALETDKVHAVRCAFMPIFISFLEDLTANNELTSETIEDILQLTHETTDRQTYPKWWSSPINMQVKFTNGNLLPANVPALTTDQQIEGVNFNSDDFYDCLHYYTNGGKMKTVQGGLNWFTLTQHKPVKTIRIKLRSKSKRLKPYGFFGVLTYIPQTSVSEQYAIDADTTNIPHVWIDCLARYNEWHQGFDHERV